MIGNVIFIILGLVGLFYGGDWLVEGASKIARSFGISSLVVGLTVVAFGTSMPELLVSVSAALRGSSDISMGNVVGSNIANIGLILGVTGIVFPIAIHIGMLRREIPILVLVTASAALMVVDGEVGRFDGVIMIIGLIAFNALMIYLARRDREELADPVDGEDVIEATWPARSREIIRMGVGLAVLLLGAQLTVNGAVNIARDLGVSELVIGITLVAVGTSLPELATSAVAAMNKQSDIAIGNVVGSNIYNLLGILGATALIKPIHVADKIVYFDGPVMLGFTLLLLPLVWNREISRREGIMLLTAYIAFSVITFIS